MQPVSRADFPLLGRTLDGKPVVYLDSAATSLKPNAVLEAERAYSTRFTANIHRGKHALSEEASAAYESARRTVARFLSADPIEVAFTRNTTESINLIARGLGLTPESVVVAPLTEHHSNLVPWMRQARTVVFEVDPLRPLAVAELQAVLERHHPKVLALGMASNVTGVVNPVAQLCEVARAHGVITVVDAAQGAPHAKLDVQALGCDFLAFSGHKMLGPAGIGVLWGRAELLERLEPLMVGGGTIEKVTRAGFTLKRLPYRLEAGTPNVSGALGLAAAIDYLEAIGPEAIAAHDAELADALADQLKDLPGARVLMAQQAPRLALASIVPASERLAPDHLALILSDSHQMMVRSGFHCARPCFEHLGVEQGAIRVSAYLYNTVEEVERFGRTLRDLLRRLS